MNSKKVREIEVKLQFKNKNRIISILKLMGFKIASKKEIKDTYYSLKKADMSNAHDLLRIREIKGAYNEITYKGRCKNKRNIWTRIELSTKIDSAETLHLILRKLKFNKISENRSKREVWKNNHTEINFIEFFYPEKLKFMEIESNSSTYINKIIKKLSNLIKKIGEEAFKKFDKKVGL